MAGVTSETIVTLWFRYFLFSVQSWLSTWNSPVQFWTDAVDHIGWELLGSIPVLVTCFHMWVLCGASHPLRWSIGLVTRLIAFTAVPKLLSNKYVYYTNTLTIDVLGFRRGLMQVIQPDRIDSIISYQQNIISRSIHVLGFCFSKEYLSNSLKPNLI